MFEALTAGKTLPEAYHNALLILHEQGEIIPCTDYNDVQKEISMTFHVEQAMAEPMISKFWIGGPHELQQYKMEILYGLLDFVIGRKNQWEYTYHNRFAYQIPFIIQELTRNPESRRAVINIRDFAVDSANNHPACLQNMQFFIRDNKLNMKVLMRSNDATEATFMNAFAFIMLQEDIAWQLGVEVGSYTHRANSFLCYGKDFALLESYVNGIRNRKLEDQTYHYTGYIDEDGEYVSGFKEMMEEEINSIYAMRDELLSHGE
jgi:thymidylate synthase